MTIAMEGTKPLVPGVAAITGALEPIALPLLRVATGALLIPHGAQKLFGMFGGYGIAGTGQFFQEQLGLAPGVLWASLVGLVELGGGILLILGLLTRPVAVAVFILMVVAALMVHLPSGFFWTGGGYEYPLLWAIAALVFAIKGGGRYSVDAALGREI